jgi:hypothetical protein
MNILGFLWIASCAAAIFMGHRKGYLGVGIVFGLALGPLGALILLMMPNKAAAMQQLEVKRDSEKRIADDQTQDAKNALERLAAPHPGQTMIKPAGIIPLRGENFIFEQQCQHGQTYTQIAHRGSSPALYIPLGHGFRGRIGGYSGTSGKVANFMWDLKGAVYVSNVRIVFKPENDPQIVNLPLSEILSFDVHPDGLALNVDKLGVQQFRTGDKRLGVIFQGMVDALTETQPEPQSATSAD